MCFAESVEKLRDNLGEVRPTVLLCVPRVWEKVNAGITALLAGDPEGAEKFNAAVEEATPLRQKIDWDEATPEEVETRVTIPLEKRLAGIAGVEYLAGIG